MTRILTLALAASAALAATAPAFANDQLIASAGLTAEQAEGMTLNQIVAAKNNRHVSFSDRQAVIVDRSGDSAELTALAVAIYNSGKGAQDMQPVPTGAGVTKAARDASTSGALEAQAIAIYNSGKSFNDRQPVE